MTAADFIKLVEGFKNQTLSPEQLEAFLDASQDPLFEQLLASALEEDLKSAWTTHLRKQEEDIQKTSVVRLRKLWRAAAAVALLVGGTAYFLYRYNDAIRKPLAMHQDAATNQISGKNVMLTIGNKQPILLDSTNNGLVTRLGNTVINNANGQLVYESGGESSPVDNKVETSAGTRYSIILPDGTKAWLNAGSSLTFPSAFTGKERTVSMTGEVYFEVAQNADHPFSVKVDHTTHIQVLGTSFNVNAYPEEGRISATLLEGAVQVNNGEQSQQLAPGQQAQIDGNREMVIIRHANTEQVMGWKNGYFIFSGVGIESIMNQFRRWYNLEVEYKGNKPADLFTGSIPLSASLEQALKILEYSRVHYELNGRKIVILPTRKGKNSTDDASK